MSDLPDSARSSALTPLPESPTTPSPQDSHSNRVMEAPDAPNPDRIARLPNIPSLNSSMEAIQTMMTQMQNSLQHHLQQQQRDFEVRMESLLIGKGKSHVPPSPAEVKPSVVPLPSVTVLADKTTEPSQPSQAGITASDPIDLTHSPEPSLAKPRQSTYVRQPSYPESYSRPYANPHSALQNSGSKIKASDLPKFRGEKGEDVEVWIEQVSAIFEANLCSNQEIVALLSVILKDTALKWFTRLGPKGRSQFPTWIHWQEALRQRFLKANYLAEKKRLWKKRELLQNEDMADYFDAKVDLQAYVFDENTPESELILDILDGLPEHMLPMLKSSITPEMDLLDFRRILLDYEKGLRWSGPWASRRQDNSTSFRSPRPNDRIQSQSERNHNPNDRFKSKTQGASTGKDPLKPPRPCTCGGMHWFRDCPKKATKSNNVSSFRSNPNRIPIAKSKWPGNSSSRPATDHPDRKNFREAHMNSVRIEEESGGIIDVALPEQDNEGFDELFASVSNISTALKTDLQYRHSDKVPTFAMAKIGSKEGSLHQVCIDTGSAISLIDSQYLRKNFPFIKVNSASTIMLKGVGSNQTHGWVNADIHFLNQQEGLTSITGAFHVVTSLATKIIVGNDVLAEEGALIDLKEGTCSFKNCKGDVPIISIRPKMTDELRPTARLQNVYTIKPGFQARVPVALTETPNTSWYMLDPVPVNDDIQVSRIVGSTRSPQHFAHVMNVGKNIVRLPAKLTLANMFSVQDSREVSAGANNIEQETPDDLEAFEEAVQEMDINVELKENEKDSLKATIRQNRQAFAYGSKRLGRTNLTTMSIETADAPPISQAPYRASPEGKKIIDETLAELMMDDVIEESDSPWASPAILVRQKGKDRFCIDYRKINEVTKADQYPIPRIDDILSQFAGKAYFSTFDANKGFHQIEIAPEDREKTAFRTHRGLHQYKRMPFGLKNGPSVFQRLMDKILGRFKWQIALVYIDDIIIYSKDVATHIQDIGTVLALVGKSGLTLSLKKCHLAYQSLTALGHTVSNLGIGTADGTVKAVKEFPQPTNVKQLQRFLGLCVYYRRFVQGFAKIAAPLYNLLKKDTPYKWDDACAETFATLKTKLTSAPLLAYPNYEKPFVLYTDACVTGLGAVLSQNDEAGQEHPIVFLSRSLTDAEKNYGITELECLAIVWSVKKLHVYLDGSKFTLITDHSALQWLFSFSGPNKRLIRWSLELQPYRENMTIKYRAGRVHTNADPLSRAPLADCNIVTMCNTISAASVESDFINFITTGYRDDPYFSNILRDLNPVEQHIRHQRFSLQTDGILLYIQPGEEYSRICIPNITKPYNLRAQILHDHHDATVSGHLGTFKTLNAVAKKFYWPGMTKDVKDYVRSCNKCQLNKAGTKSYGLHQALAIPPYRWHTVTIDFAGPFVPSGEGEWDMVMVVVDKLTKRTHFIPSKQIDKAPDVARRFFDSIVRLHGMPSVIVSDRDPKFTSMFWSTLFERFGTRLAMSSANHPQSDGQTERMVRTLKEMLRSTISHRQHDWTDKLAALEFAYNNSIHPSTGLSPFELDLGLHPQTPYSLLVESERDVEAVEDFIQNLEGLQHQALEALQKARDLQTQSVNKNRPRPQEFNVGDMVLLSHKLLRTAASRTKGSKKLRGKYSGPFQIAKKISPTAYQLDLPANIRIHPTVNIEYLKQYHSSPTHLGPREVPSNPDPILTTEGTEEYEVDRVLAHRYHPTQGYSYLVSWKGYALHDATWEPESNLDNAGEAISAYLDSLPLSKAPVEMHRRSSRRSRL